MPKAPMSDHADQDKAHARALRNADYASLMSRAVTDNSRALVDDVLRLITEVELRKTKRVSKEEAFRQAAEGLLADLLLATRRDDPLARWVYRSVSQRHFTDDVVSYRDFTALRKVLKTLGLLEEAPGVQHWSGFDDGQLVVKRWATRFKATPLLEQLAAQHGIQPTDVSEHFIRGLPEHPLVLKGGSRRAPEGYQIPGTVQKITYTFELRTMEQTIKNLNSFLDQFTITGGTHRGYVRVFNLGDHPAFKWDLGGRVYSLGDDSYQQTSSDERLKMKIAGQPVCELDIKASYLTIFQARAGHPLDFTNDPYVLPGLGAASREVVKSFITTTFGNSGFAERWSRDAIADYRKRTRQYPFALVRDAVATAYPLLAALRQNEEEPPIWATLMYHESEAVLKTMLALKDLEVPSLSVHDSLIVQREREELAKAILKQHYHATTGAIPHIVTEGL